MAFGTRSIRRISDDSNDRSVVMSTDTSLRRYTGLLLRDCFPEGALLNWHSSRVSLRSPEAAYKILSKRSIVTEVHETFRS